MKCTCAYSWGAQAITPWYEKISQAQMEQIARMAEGPGGYLTVRQKILRARV